MSLVAYDSSDEGSENEDNEPAVAVAVNDVNKDATEAITVQINAKLSLPAPRMISQITNDEEEDNNSAEPNFIQLLSTLPKPRDPISMENIEEVEDDILLKKETESQIPKPAKKQTVKISVPSLSEFKDLEEENEKKPARIVQPSQKGCGLFAVLVPPKGETASSKTLIPQVVKNATVKTNIQQSKVMRKSSTSQSDSIVKKQTSDKSHDELSSDEEEASIDFFGLAVDKDISDSSTTGLLDSELVSDDIHKSSVEDSFVRQIKANDMIHDSSSSVLSSGQSNKILISNVINLPKEEILLKNKAEVGPKLPVPEQEYNVDVEGNVAFDEKAIEYLCGKRGIKRKEIAEADIIEINGEDIKPDEREWLVKALTEEPVQRPVSMQSCGVNSQSKKKHQITYLAHQAKAMELELKNQWSQNRMARKQTKSKYGF
ncbi:hypothetical protein P5V15_003463 [Pogonomyrmex californicus]